MLKIIITTASLLYIASGFTTNIISSEVETKQVLVQRIRVERPQLVLYYTPSCYYSQKVLNYLKQIHKTVPMKNIKKDGAAKKELKRIGGKTQVPCLSIDGKAMYESDDIIQWLSKHQEWLDPA